ncbi:hydantoinase/oxoprolinase family protein [Acidicapsa dinghuensis]|uniref:Hydantoinase/oxoprolinase family protein n=1 Tax=Acidicapsa dinghuensis TaxID=2218256 RepID=A0ABW1EIL1_9BACT|nr:hydantoinase/oxoprolinase family protein [Acidicapsa dinghuensis]
MRVAIDSGGTFTDCVYLADGELRVVKVFSTPADPSRGVLDGLSQIVAREKYTGALDVRHGTTVGTNAMLERKGARVAFVTTKGLEDTIAIGRQTRQRLYDWFAPLPECLVPRELRFGVPERVSAEGAMLREPTEEELQALLESVRASGAEAVAISLLFSFTQPITEQRVEASLHNLGVPVSVSHRILPEFREYERAATTVVNAYLAPRMQSYLERLEREVTAKHPESRVDVMQSSGGILPARVAAEQPVRTVLSGPAGGVIGAITLARWAGFERIIGFDMGGTSTDVFLADAAQGGARLTRESIVAGMPISVPMLDIHTVGSGGGSIARFDAGGMLRVGPESAGADPGPICFGKGDKPTVTDANYILGRMDADSFLGGSVTLHDERARVMMQEHKGPLTSVEEFAAGILRVVETNMEKAIRVISVERGLDPREFALVAFGGGGPLHACALARALGIGTVLVPALPGALSAVGILLADAVRDYSRTVMLASDDADGLQGIFTELEKHARHELRAEYGESVREERVSLLRTLDVRYRGQGYELNVAFDPSLPAKALDNFHDLHAKSYGFSHRERPVEIVNVRLRIAVAAEPYAPKLASESPNDGSDACTGERSVWFDGVALSSSVYARDRLRAEARFHGPALITEYTSATLLPPGSGAHVDTFGNLIVTVGEMQA